MGNQISLAEETVNNCFPAELLDRNGNFNLSSFSKLAMDEKLPAADSRVGVAPVRKWSDMIDTTKLEQELEQVWQDIPIMPKAHQGKMAVYDHSILATLRERTIPSSATGKFGISYTNSGVLQNEKKIWDDHKPGLQTNEAYFGAVQGNEGKVELFIAAYLSEYNNLTAPHSTDQPITDRTEQLLAQFLQVIEPSEVATLGKKSNATPKTSSRRTHPKYINHCLFQLDDIFADAKIEYAQWNIGLEVQNQFQKETRGSHDRVQKTRGEIEQLKLDVEDGQLQVRELTEKLDKQKEKMDSGKTSWSEFAFSVTSVLAAAISIAVPFFCPSLAPIWLTVIEFACKAAPFVLCRILPTMFTWVMNFLKKLWQKTESSKS